MRNNPAYNQTAPGGKSPEIHIHHEEVRNPTSKEIVERVVSSARKMAGNMSRNHLEAVVESVFSEIILSQITDTPSITVTRLNELLEQAGVILICTVERKNQ